MNEDLITFQGTQEEYKALLDKAVREGRLSQGTADAMFVAFPSQTTFVQDLQMLEDYASEIAKSQRQQNFVNAAQEEPSLISKITNAFKSTTPLSKNFGAVLSGINLIRGSTVSGAVDHELEQMETQEALDELEERENLREQTFLERLSNPYLYERLAQTPNRVLGQAITLVPNLYSLSKFGLEDLTGLDLGAQATLEAMVRNQRELERFLNTSPAITTEESLIEALPGAILPGGPAVKAAGFATDFLVDQSIRELTDTTSEEYDTIFDRLGLVEDTSEPVIGVGAATTLALGAGLFTGRFVSPTKTSSTKTSSTKTGPEIKSVRGVGIETAERAKDLFTAMVASPETALNDIMKRLGVQNPDKVTRTINMTSHSALMRKINTALNVGNFSIPNASFQNKVSPVALARAYYELPKNTRQQVGLYLNLRDRLDDIKIRIKEDPSNTKLTNQLKPVRDEINRIEKQFPKDTRVFSGQYRNITRELRKFAFEAGLISKGRFDLLNKTRQNYVALEINDIDLSESLWKRINQAMKSFRKSSRSEDRVLHTREIADEYDISSRNDPMELLLKNIENVLSLGAKNHARATYLDAALKSEYGSRTLRSATAEEIGVNNERLVAVYVNGKKKNFITSQLTADALRFEAYIPKVPWLVIPKNIFEWSAAGVIYPGFALTTLIRDSIAGLSIANKQAKRGIGFPLRVASSIPGQLHTQFVTATRNWFQKLLLNNPDKSRIHGMSRKRIEDSINKMSENIAQSIYHIADQRGGLDAAQSNNRMQAIPGVFQEIMRSADSAIETVPGHRQMKAALKTTATGLYNIFNSIQNAPRAAVFRKTVSDGANIDDAIMVARSIAGDTKQIGRTHLADGAPIDIDAVNRGPFLALLRAARPVITGAREALPFFNPAVQGWRQVIKSVRNQPIAFAARTTTFLMVPTFISFMWNHYFGKQYNDYAMRQRSASNVALYLYIARPGQSVHEGIEVPLPHEYTMFVSPLLTFLYNEMYEDPEGIVEPHYSEVFKAIVGNSVDFGTPVTLDLILNMLRIKSSGSLFWPEAYKRKEDYEGILPENAELALRTLFAGLGGFFISFVNAMARDPSLFTAAETASIYLQGSVPIWKGASGLKTTNTLFGHNNIVFNNKMDALATFEEIYNQHFARINERGQETAAKRDATVMPPSSIYPPTNPLYKVFGKMIHDAAYTGDAVKLRKLKNTYIRIAQRIRAYTPGHKELLHPWIDQLQQTSPDEEGVEIWHTLLEVKRDANGRVILDKDGKVTFGVDLKTYAGRVKVINKISAGLSEIITSQIGVLSNLENEITNILIEEKYINRDQRFEIEKHLDPYDPQPFKL